LVILENVQQFGLQVRAHFRDFIEKIVPLLAISKLAGLAPHRTLNAPCSNPKSSDSRSSPGSAAQFTFTNGWLRRFERR